MTDKRKPPETPGMAEVSAEFVHEAEAAVEAVAFDPLLETVRKYREADTASDRAFDALDEAEGAAMERGVAPGSEVSRCSSPARAARLACRGPSHRGPPCRSSAYPSPPASSAA